MTKDESDEFSAKLVTSIRKKLGEDVSEDIRCSFCRKPGADVEELIAGSSAYICNECVSKCAKLMRERGLDV
jgi:hypothetical protein